MQSKLQKRLERPLSEAEIDHLSLPEIAQYANLMHIVVERGAQAARQIGLLLMRAKREIPYGQFGKWIEKNCRFSVRRAQEYMRFAQRQPDESLDHLGVDAVLDLHAQHKVVTAKAETEPVSEGQWITIKSSPQPPVHYAVAVAVAAPARRPHDDDAREFIRAQRGVNLRRQLEALRDAVRLLGNPLMSPEEVWAANDRFGEYHFDDLPAAIEFLQRLEALSHPG